jgi:hypothetical protein
LRATYAKDEVVVGSGTVVVCTVGVVCEPSVEVTTVLDIDGGSCGVRCEHYQNAFMK